MKKNDNDQNRRYIHLVIGITGHRDIVNEDRELLKDKIREIFKELRSRYANTPLLLITSLAEGADRIGAEVALEMGIEYIVPLPLPYEEYIKDFPNTKDEFDKFLEKSLGYFELPIEKSELESSRDYGPSRDKRYEKVGAFIAKYSQILIALWDGKDIGLIGGTSQVVKFKLNGLPSEYAPYRTILDTPDTGPVYHILTRRMKNRDEFKNYTPEIKKMLPEFTNEETFFGNRGIFSKIDNFNKRIRDLEEEEIKKSRESLASGVVEKEKFISYIYSEADALAIKFKKKWNFLQLFLLFITGTLLGVFLGYTYLNSLYLLIGYFIAYVLLTYLFKVRNLSHSYHESYVEYRSLAEGLRVEFFLRLAGVHEDSADRYLRKHRQHLQWIREVMRSANIFDPQSTPDLESIKKYWIDGQYEYYRNSSMKNKIILRRLKVISAIFFFGGIASILGAIIFTVLHLYDAISSTIILIITLPTLAGLIETYISRSTLQETGEEYSRMKSMYESAIKLWKENDDVYNIQIIMELSKEALRENADWLLLHHQIPEKIPL
jgi:uncharacterized membrane protein HdeD (DUF308 family)